MSISILNRGASGGMTASIIVNGLSETDIVTASNGSKTKNGVWNATDRCHEINGITDLGLWTVTATNGERTDTQDVLIEVIGLHEIEMDYKLYALKLSAYPSGYSSYNVSESGVISLNARSDVATSDYHAAQAKIVDRYGNNVTLPVGTKIVFSFTSNRGSGKDCGFRKIPSYSAIAMSEDVTDFVYTVTSSDVSTNQQFQFTAQIHNVTGTATLTITKCEIDGETPRIVES